jgi:nucleoid-associated protein YgaU
MQPIERYGLVALVFLGITITAACLWEPDGDSTAPESQESAAAPQSRDFVGARTQEGARQPKALSAAQRQDLLALQRGGQQDPAGIPLGAGRKMVGDALAAGSELGLAPGPEPEPEQAPAFEPLPEPEDRQADPAPALPRPPATRLYEIKGDDTLSEIAMRELGTWKRWQEIVDLNPGLDPNQLRKGARLKLPAGSPAASGKPAAPRAGGEPAKAPAQGPIHVVQENESLWKIAAVRLGQGERWGEIAALNPDVDPDRLKTGMKLVLPAGAGRTSGAAPERGLAQAEPAAQPTTGKVR